MKAPGKFSINGTPFLKNYRYFSAFVFRTTPMVDKIIPDNNCGRQIRRAIAVVIISLSKYRIKLAFGIGVTITRSI